MKVNEVFVKQMLQNLFWCVTINRKGAKSAKYLEALHSLRP